MIDRDKLRSKDLNLPKPSWSGKLPSAELSKVRPIAQRNLFEIAYYGIEYRGRPLDELAVAQVAATLGSISQEFVQAKGRVAFFRYGDKSRQIILPLRRSNISADEARNSLNDIIRKSTALLEDQGLPVVDFLPFSLNPFSERQLGER